MTKPKKQHYVPQFLLRYFATGKKLKAKLWVLDKLNVAIFQASVRDIAHENMFYEYHGEAGNYEYESLMEKLDTRAAGIIADIVDSTCLPTDPQNSIYLSYFVAAQMLRTPVTRKDMDNFRDLIVHKWGDEITAEGDSRPISDYGPEDSKVSSLRLLREIPSFAKLLQDKVWCLCKSPDAMPYIIADNPVCRHNMMNRGMRGNLGLKNDGIELYMPLSPRWSLQIVCPKVAMAALHTTELRESYSYAMNDNKPIILKPENVEFINSLQVIWAERFVFARHRDHLEVPLSMLQSHPDLRQGTGVRQKPGDV